MPPALALGASEMIEHISIRNFQSWRKLDLELGPVTMLVGKGNSGKTAIIRALKYALTNQSGDDFIREGAAGADVGFTTEKDVLLWSKNRGKGGVYNLNGEMYTKTGSTVPPEVSATLGMNEIAIDKTTSLMPNIQMQFDAPFIIGESGSKIARILGRLTKLNILVTAQMACRSDADAARGDARAAAILLEQTVEQLRTFPDTTALTEQFKDLNASTITINAQGLALSQARRLLIQRDRAVALRDAGQTVPRLREEARKLTDKATALYPTRSLLLRLHNEQAKMADAGVGIDRAGEALDEAKAVYDAACKAAGVCEACPWR
jgi:DNA repair exonuclease SbcCD ATPase subunit